MHLPGMQVGVAYCKALQQMLANLAPELLLHHHAFQQLKFCKHPIPGPLQQQYPPGGTLGCPAQQSGK